MLLPIGESNHSKRSGNHTRTTWAKKKGKPRNKNCKNTNWETGSMMSTTEITYQTLLSMNTVI